MKVDGQAVPEDRLDKHSQRLDVDPRDKALAEVDFQPPDLKQQTEKCLQNALLRQCNDSNIL